MIDIISTLGILVDIETIEKAKSLLPHNPDMNICQRLEWIRHQHMDLYRQTKEPIHLALTLYSSEAREMAKKMNDRLVEYKNEENLRLG